MHGFGFQIDLKLTKFNGSSFFVKSQSAVLNFCHLTSFSFGSLYPKNLTSLCKFFCQIIMGSPLNDNVSKWRIVPLCLLPVPRLFHPFCLLAAKKTGAHFYHSKYFTSIHNTANISIHYPKYVCIHKFLLFPSFSIYSTRKIITRSFCVL